MKKIGAVVVAISICFASADAQEQAPPTPPAPAPSAATSLTPTPSEIATQVRGRAALEAEAGAAERLTQENEKLRREIEDLRKSTAAQTEETRKKLQDLEAEKRRTEQEVGQRILALRRATLPAWSGSLSGLQAGLAAAKGIGSVGVSLTFTESGPPTWAKWVDYAGRLLAGGGGLAAAFANEQGSRDDALQLAAGGVATYFIGNYIGERLKAKSSDELRIFVERVSMHRNFTSDLHALQASVAGVYTEVEPLEAKVHDLLLAFDDCAYATFKVEPRDVEKYRAVLDAYEALITDFAHTNRTATELLSDKEREWTAPIARDLTAIKDSTDTAIKKWREQVLLTERIVDNLQLIATPRVAVPIPAECRSEQ